MFSSLEDQGFATTWIGGHYLEHFTPTAPVGPPRECFGASALSFSDAAFGRKQSSWRSTRGKERSSARSEAASAGPSDTPAFGPAYRNDPRNGRQIADIGQHGFFRTYGMEALTRFATAGTGLHSPRCPCKDDAPRMARSPPSGARTTPAVHLLTGNAHFIAPTPLNGPARRSSMLAFTDEVRQTNRRASEMFLIKNDPRLQ